MRMPPDAVDEVDALVVTNKCERLRAVQSDSPAGVCRVGSTISALMRAAENGDIAAADTLFSTLYSELHRLAKRELAKWGTAATLSVTTLLHEAYLDIANAKANLFLSVRASWGMRRV